MVHYLVFSSFLAAISGFGKKFTSLFWDTKTKVCFILSPPNVKNIFSLKRDKLNRKLEDFLFIFFINTAAVFFPRFVWEVKSAQSQLDCAFSVRMKQKSCCSAVWQSKTISCGSNQFFVRKTGWFFCFIFQWAVKINLVGTMLAATLCVFSPCWLCRGGSLLRAVSVLLKQRLYLCLFLCLDSYFWFWLLCARRGRI